MDIEKLFFIMFEPVVWSVEQEMESHEKKCEKSILQYTTTTFGDNSMRKTSFSIIIQKKKQTNYNKFLDQV